MTEKEFRELCMDIISEVDYDISKQYDEKTAECPDEVEDNWNRIFNFIRNKYPELIQSQK